MSLETARAARSTEPLLSAHGLAKSYGGRRVVDHLSLQVDAGTVVGLLGANGAGKTTAIRILYGLVDPEEGSIFYAGLDFGLHRTEAKRMIGVCTQDDTLDPDFSAAENLRVYARYFGLRAHDVRDRADELVERFGLRPYANHRPSQLSGGYRKRLMIARSVIHSPRVLFLDEPTTGLDPKARVDLWELVNDLRASGMAIVLTTHYMDEAERLSDAMVVMQQGKEVAKGTPADVLGGLLGEHVLVVPSGAPEQERIEKWLQHEQGVATHRVLGELRAALTAEQLALLTRRMPGARLTVRPPNLDDLFLQLSHEPPRTP